MQAWRSEAEDLRKENRLLREEIDRLKAQKTKKSETVTQVNAGKSDWLTFTATAYTADCSEGCTGITATGIDVHDTTHINGARVIATDPSAIPLGSTVEIRFSNGMTERAVASDTGGAINGNIIDYLVRDTETARQFGRQSVKIRIINEGER